MPYHDILIGSTIRPANPSTAGAYAIRADDTRTDGFLKFGDLAFADVDATATLWTAHLAAIGAIQDGGPDAYLASSQSFDAAAAAAQVALDAANAYAAIAKERLIRVKAASGAAFDHARNLRR